MRSAPPSTVVSMYAARADIFPREADGRYARLRWLCVWLTQAVFYGLPWLRWNGRQAVLFDLGARKFYLFGIVLWPQDFIYLAGLLIICAAGLFLVTAVAGRVWCGFACPQTVYTEIFLWIERRVEGTRSARMRLARQPWSWHKLTLKLTKHLAWGVVALWTGFSFVGYFTPIHSLWLEIGSMRLGPWESFWILFYALATYGNAGRMREQVCKYMCPYARFQSAMFDQSTLIITYDTARGEPRGAHAGVAAAAIQGDCIDCTLCAQVCPTGIDIRQGLQYECIGCAACVDACNSVMKKIDRPTGLIRYWTGYAMRDGLTDAQIRRQVARPRIMIYSTLLALIITVFSAALINRTPLKLDVIRDRGALSREGENGTVDNVYRLVIMNTAEIGHRFRISVSGLPSMQLIGVEDVLLAGTEARAVPVRVRGGHGSGRAGSNPITFTLTALDAPRLQVAEKAIFIVPK